MILAQFSILFNNTLRNKIYNFYVCVLIYIKPIVEPEIDDDDDEVLQ